MQPLRRPFGTAGRAVDVIWPGWTGPSGHTRAATRPPELWERGPDSENSPGERVLADLDPDTRRTDALLILARYLVVRVALQADRPASPAFNEQAERDSAHEYLAAIRGDAVETRWLAAVLEACSPGAPRALVSRLSAAAASASRRGHENGAFALRLVAWNLARRNNWHDEAGRVARSIATAADRGGGRRSRSLWSRRARIHEARARRLAGLTDQPDR